MGIILTAVNQFLLNFIVIGTQDFPAANH